jgi:hypothetical protein
MKTKYYNLSMLENILNNDVIIINFLQASSLNATAAILEKSTLKGTTSHGI